MANGMGVTRALAGDTEDRMRSLVLSDESKPAFAAELFFVYSLFLRSLLVAPIQ